MVNCFTLSEYMNILKKIINNANNFILYFFIIFLYFLIIYYIDRKDNKNDIYINSDNNVSNKNSINSNYEKKLRNNIIKGLKINIPVIPYQIDKN